MTLVRIVPWPGGMPDGSVRTGEHLVVLVDDEAHRAAPLWLRVHGGKSLWRLLGRPAGDAAMVGSLQETAARLLVAAGVTVTGVDVEPASENVPELHSDTVTARVGLATADGARHVLVTPGYGLVLAAAAGAPVRVADELMDRLAVPAQGEDVLAPFRLPEAARATGRRQRTRFEPRNMAFTDGLDRWKLSGSFLDAGQPHWQDYACGAADRSAALASAVPEPSGFAVLAQAIYADDYRGATVTFRGELRTIDVAGHAGLYLAAGRPDEPVSAGLRDVGDAVPAGPGGSDWSWHEVTASVPGDAGVVRFGVFLAGRGRIELRNAELSPAPAGNEELGEHGHRGRRSGAAGTRR